MRASPCINPACVGGCPPNRGDRECLWLLSALLAALLFVSQPGCVPHQPGESRQAFDPQQLEGCLTLVVDMSASFASRFDERAAPLMLEVIDRFFTQAAGGESRVVIAQLSGSDDVVLFEASPADLRARFRSPAELTAFLRDHADPGGSAVYRAVGRAVEYTATVPGVTENTRLMTVVLSDLADNEGDRATRRASGERMVEALRAYQQLGGGLALYFVDPAERPRWREILRLAGFSQEQQRIESSLVARPELPRFD